MKANLEQYRLLNLAQPPNHITLVLKNILVHLKLICLLATFQPNLPSLTDICRPVLTCAKSLTMKLNLGHTLLNPTQPSGHIHASHYLSCTSESKLPAHKFQPQPPNLRRPVLLCAKSLSVTLILNYTHYLFLPNIPTNCFYRH